MKIHLGCGPCYLTDGWVNVDVARPGMHLAKDRPDLVRMLGTTEEAYYAKHPHTMDTLREPVNRDGLCDVHGTAQHLPFEQDEADELLARQVFEHLSLAEARSALLEFYRVLKPGGILRLDVPDHDGTVQELMKSHDPFYFRHLYGSRASQYGYHLMSYNQDSLRFLVESCGLEYVGSEPNIHFYPAFCLRFAKRPPYPPAWKYVLSGLNLRIPDDWRCVDIGPGKFPWPRANAYVDIDRDNFKGIRDGKETFFADLDEGALPFKDKEFDFAFSSHCMEHLEDPRKAAKEISRVAKRGVVVVPHMLKEVLGCFEEASHQWWITMVGERMLFMRPDRKRIDGLRDENVMKAMCRLFRSGPDVFGSDSVILREWFLGREFHLDAVKYWEGEFKVEVVD